MPPFKELLKGIRNYSGLPQSQHGYYSYTPQPIGSDHSNSRQSSYTSIAESSDGNITRQDRLLSIGFSPTLREDLQDLQFATLAKVSGSQYYSSPDSNKKKEEDILSFLTWFLPGNAALNDCFNEMNANLFKGRLTGSRNVPTDILFSRDLQRNEFAITRDEFKKWVTEIPDVLYNNMSTSLEKFSLILHELKIMKYNYMLENEIEIRQRKVQVEQQHKPEPGATKSLSREYNSIGNMNTKRSDIRDLDRDLTQSPPMGRDVRVSLPKESGNQKVRKPKTKIHHIKKQKVKCKHCDSIETPEWRRGPDGSRTLCNACGLFYSKLTKRYGTHDAVIVMKCRKTDGYINDRTVPTVDALKRIIEFGLTS